MLKHLENIKRYMEKIFGFVVALLLLNGCAQSVALLGPSVSNGKIAQSSFNSSISYAVKKQTGKTPLEHAIAYAEEKNPERKKEPCLSFVHKTNSEICAIVKKQINLTKSKILKNSRDKTLKALRSSIKPDINKTY